MKNWVHFVNGTVQCAAAILVRSLVGGLVLAVGFVCLGQDCQAQPIFRSPKTSAPVKPVQSVGTGSGLAPITNVSIGAAGGQFKLPQVGAPALMGPAARQSDGFENSTLREVGVAGQFLPQQNDSQGPAVELEIPEFDLGALGLVDPADSNSEDAQAGAAEDPREPLSLMLGAGEPDSAADQDPDQQVLRREQVVENYPDGRPRLIRSVALDAEGNYFNDGPWVVKNRDGQTIAAGRYKKGVMNGQWGRRHVSSEGGLFVTKPFTLFQEPFDSIANFEDGKLDGQWAIYDRSKRTVFEINYDQGKRDGPATWFYPDTTPMRSATFKQGVLHGEVSEWDEDGRLTSKDYYHEGRKLVRSTSFYRPEVPKEQAYYLDVKLEQDGFDNWWEAKPAPYLSSGQREQAGQARAWYSNRQLQYRGQFRNDKPVGPFFWWHENGNRSTVGQFDRDGNRTGKWIWWHENGLKQIEGSYRIGQPSGTWRSWSEDGQLIKTKNYESEREAVDPIESIESILELSDGDAESGAGELNGGPGEASGEGKKRETTTGTKRGNSELPLPKLAEPQGIGSASEGKDDLKAKSDDVLESLGPPLDESLLKDELPVDAVDPSVVPTNEKAGNASDDDVAPFDLKDLLGG
jgi:antitoxin component YwqK of YwqJK toxin-antitoxin module